MISALQHESKYKSKFNFDFFWKKKSNFGEFPSCSTREYISNDVSINYCKTDIDEARAIFFFSGYGQMDGFQTDKISESSYGNMSEYKKFQTKGSKLGVSCRSLYASPDDGDA